MPLTTTERSFTNNLWEFFCSLKLTLFLLISLALTSIIGTVLPQGALPPEYVASISPSKLQIYSKLGFFDMYHSWWFIALLYVFSLNLVSCSIKRLPHVFKFISEPALVLADGMRNSFPLKKEISFSASVEKGKEQLAEFLGKEFSAPQISEHNGEFHLFAQKTAWCRLGVYVVHFSILVIFVGAIIGSLGGYKGFVNIVEGTSVNSFEGRNGQQMPLGFELLCEKFSVEFYATGAPKEFKSILTVLENGKPVPGYSQVKVIVNEPLTYKGITFYQSSYGPANNPSAFFFSVRQRAGGKTEEIVLRPGIETALPDGRTATIVDLTDNPGEGLAALLSVGRKGEEPKLFKVMKSFPTMDEMRGDNLIFSFIGTDAKQYTGLQVAKDPGVWVVWLGCTLMVIGIAVAFFMSHKRIWIVVSKGHARMYGNASKNQAAFQMQFEDLSEKFLKTKI
jgi:cytochrome c biogenesis protein